MVLLIDSCITRIFIQVSLQPHVFPLSGAKTATGKTSQWSKNKIPRPEIVENAQKFRAFSGVLAQML